jgi:hypothetical protein
VAVAGETPGAEGDGEDVVGKHDDVVDEHTEAVPTAAPVPDEPVPAKYRGMYYKQGLGLAFRCESFCVYVCMYICHGMQCDVM